MSVRVRDVLMGQLDQLRHEPVGYRVRARLGDQVVVDTREALLVWEPRRIVPEFAVPVADVVGTVEPAPAGGVGEDPMAAAPMLGERRVLDPSVPFAAHTAPGERLEVVSGASRAAAYRLDDPDLAGHVLLEFAAFDEWRGEDELLVSHPRDPFHRIDILSSSAHVRVELDGVTLAESDHPLVLLEPPLPPRFYLDPADVRTDLLTPTDTETWCAYKGRASYWARDGHGDVAWVYEEPLRDAAEVRGRIAFFTERVDVVVDGRRPDRPVTPWSS
ncbi:MAG: DUF427 domain-containing protein [Nocardioidaceae bacterium]